MDKNIKRSAAIGAHLEQDLYPFFSFIKWGADTSHAYSVEGKFAFSFGEDGGYYKTGLIMPISLIGESTLFQRIKDAIAYLKTLPIEDKMAESRELFQTYLNQNGLEMLQVDSSSYLKGLITLKMVPSFFEKMLPYLKYVSAFEIENDVMAKVYESKPAFWKNLADVAFWLLGWDDYQTQFYDLPDLVIVLDEITCNQSYFYHRRDFNVNQLPHDLAEFFALKPTIPTSSLDVWISETKDGWAKMQLTIDENMYAISCSNVYDPLESLLGLARSVDLGDLPVVIRIEEEGPIKKIEIHQTDHEDKIYFILYKQSASENPLIVQAIFDKSHFVATFKTAFRNFFENRYDALHWECNYDNEPPIMKDRVLNDPWMNS